VTPSHWLSDCPLTVSDLREIPFYRENDIAIFQKQEGENTIDLIEFLTRRGVRVIYLDCDLPLKKKEVSRASWIVCPSKTLARHYQDEGFSNISYIPDAYEYCHGPKSSQNKKKLQCVWFGVGSPEKWRSVDYLKNLLKDSRLNSYGLLTISDSSLADVRWSIKNAWGIISNCDVAVIPRIGDDWEEVKSSNRAIQAMALGLPVVAYPIPAYKEVITDGWNGFLCHNDEEWIRALILLKDNEFRFKVAMNAYRSVLSTYSIDNIGSLWERLLHQTMSEQKGTRTQSHIEIRKIRSRAYVRLADAGRLSLRIKYIISSFSCWPFEKKIYSRKLLGRIVSDFFQ
jgi:hypothetical protein